MRNAAANFDDDFAIEAPVRKKSAGRSGSSKSSGKRKKKGRSRFAFAVDMHKVARYAAIGMSVTVAVGIMVNALMMQKGRHPAPLFGKSIEIAEATSKPATKATPEKAQLKQAEPETAPLPHAQAKSEPAESDASSTKSDATSAKNDMIGRLIQGGSVPADHPDQKTVLDAQRALVRLGFPLKATGTFGPQTKKAIERFEKDHHLPVKGELSRRTMKALTVSAAAVKAEH